MISFRRAGLFPILVHFGCVGWSTGMAFSLLLSDLKIQKVNFCINYQVLPEVNLETLAA